MLDTSHYTVLFVDDEPYILNSLKRLFHSDPMRVITAGSAEEALGILKAEQVQLLVTDNLMPGMCGVDLIKKVKEEFPDVLRIILSGQSDCLAILRAINEGEAFRFVLKPWNDMDLKVTINMALAHYKLYHERERLLGELKMQTRLLKSLQEKHPELFADLTPGQPYELEPDENAPEAPAAKTEEVPPCPRP